MKLPIAHRRLPPVSGEAEAWVVICIVILGGWAAIAFLAKAIPIVPGWFR